MADLLKLCNQYFGTKDFYEVLNITNTATGTEIKKAYRKVSLLVHPDRVEQEKKLEATEKFKILSKIHSVLSDKNKRAVYDESGEFDEDDDVLFNWLDYWRSLFKPISMDDIKRHEEEYIGSEIEINDVKKAYLGSRGSMDSILEQVPFSNHDHEPRYMDIIQKLIENGEVPEYKTFTEEPEKKKLQRKKKWEKEKALAAEIDVDKLNKEIQQNQARREKDMAAWFADMEERYSKKKPSKRKSIKNVETSSPAKRTRSKK